MNLTFTSGYEKVKSSQAASVGELAEELSKGLLMGARGNSGVILSQLFRGFGQAIKNKESIDGGDLAKAFKNSAKLAYEAIMKPQEGTILTVARESAEAGLDKAKESSSALDVMQAVYDGAEQALAHTPELLPVLKEVGVVDSGGQGLLYIYQGFLSILKGEEIDLDNLQEDMVETINIKELAHQQDHYSSEAMNTEDIEFGFCTEIMVRLGEGRTVQEEFDYDTFRNHLATFGDSLLVVADDEIAKVHIHTEQPGEIMNYGQRFGNLIKIKVDNMREQHRELVEQQHREKQAHQQEAKDYGIIAVASGEGMVELFKNFGADYIIEGGQTMNPSTQDFLDAIDQLNIQKAILLPNNSNIFMAAKQAAENTNIEAAVVSSRNISQGLTSLLAFHPEASLEDNVDAMTEEMEFVKNGQITYAIRDTKINNLNIEKDDFMGLINGDVVLAEKELADAAFKTIESMLEDDSEVLTIIYGDSVTDQQAEALATQVEEAFDDLEIEVFNGQQPVYAYTFSVE